MLLCKTEIILPVVEEIASHLTENKLTLSTCESCTGGLISSLMTYLPGSSTWYLGGASTYSNDSKIAMVSVKTETLKNHGAVSQKTAEEMAAGISNVTGSDFSISTTGIAGPTGALPGKPVGTVWCAIKTPSTIRGKLLSLSGDRNQIRSDTVLSILKELLLELTSSRH